MTSEKDDDFLDQMTEADTEEGETPEPEAVEVEKGEPETAKVEPEAPPTPEAAKEPATVPLASLKAEREKRQRKEAELQRLEAELAALRQQATNQPKAEPVDFYADPEGYVSTVVSKVEQQAQARLYAVLDAEAREAFADYDELMEELVPKVQANPALKQQIFSSPNPAKAAYQLAKQMKAMESIQDPIAYQQQLRAQVRAELEAEMKAKAEAAASAARAIPPDLANTRSASTKGAEVLADPFRELFPD